MKNIETDIVVYGNLRAEYAMIVQKSNVENRIEVLEALDEQINNQLSKIKFLLSGGLTNDSAIEQLKQYFAGRDSDLHIIIDSRDSQTSEQWTDAGGPHTWVLVETDNEHSVYIDVGYGYIALFENGVLAGCSDTYVNTATAVAMDRDYYGTTKYIWK